MPYCSNCGTKIELSYKFCSICGTKLNKLKQVVKMVHRVPLSQDEIDRINERSRKIEENKIYKISEAAELLNYSTNTIRRLIKAGEIKKTSKPNRDIKIWGNELLGFLGNCENID